MNDFKIIVPNLKRRPDRWFTCLGYLLAQGIPDRIIEYWEAHDGSDYESVHEARTAASKEFATSKYLMEGEVRLTWDYCWLWTWHEIITAIANESDDSMPRLVLLDDHAILLDYEQIREYVRVLYEMPVPFRIVQFAATRRNNPRVPLKTDLAKVCAAPKILKHGLTGSGDLATLISPLGARDLIALANENPCKSPEGLMWIAAWNRPQSGYYSAVDVDVRYIRSQYISGFQDRSQIEIL